MENSKNTFILEGEDGTKKEFEVLFTFDSDETKKSYIVYTDNDTDDSGNIKVYASIYDPTGASSKLEPIKTEKEWQVVEDLLASIQKKMAEKTAEQNETN